MVLNNASQRWLAPPAINDHPFVNLNPAEAALQDAPPAAPLLPLLHPIQPEIIIATGVEANANENTNGTDESSEDGSAAGPLPPVFAMEADIIDATRYDDVQDVLQLPSKHQGSFYQALSPVLEHQ
ncbi:hypothetical protein BX616_002771 [Lobosporangium transversale]|uniref:Uncharacterized protein n=1 Tax=Lobosporangium transversale TaxID=64571 RepID=A0A1Y2GA03_9FUNG|nr:hypothetical protein BCR41DRAFT_374686 [Lobosporangium transversale]KAF9899951.1 hypothetical protein BX616_002771 [Lobosporangium transversale]ORZ05013.1 hypothetical protein BCR41DRAFT_374686 [Lobosporangium transversale]|eukprot:XP_021876877.1 hypothetical protein BCR41DRAFT_374686 [Lobosporangium transversale]